MPTMFYYPNKQIYFQTDDQIHIPHPLFQHTHRPIYVSFWKNQLEIYDPITKQSPTFSLHSEPKFLYKLPKRSQLEKFEDALLCQSSLVSQIKLLFNSELHIVTNFQTTRLQSSICFVNRTRHWLLHPTMNQAFWL